MTLDEVRFTRASPTGPTLLRSSMRSLAQGAGARLKDLFMQSCGKLRCIDSGKKPGRNAASREREVKQSSLAASM